MTTRRGTGRAAHFAVAALLAASLTIGCAGDPAQRATRVDAPATARAKLESELTAALERARVESGAPGALLGVRRGGDPLLAVARGLADRESGRPLGADDPYFQGSITKIHTAALVLRLAEEGRLALDDPLARYVPEFPDGARIRVRHLLAQTSGLKDFYLYLYLRPDPDEMISMVTRRWSQPELLELSARFGSYFEPGTDWDYSSTNYFLLGVIAERASGLSLVEAYRRYLHTPLGLTRTWLHGHEPARGILPTGYMGTVPAWKHSAMFGELGATTVLDRSSVEWSAGGLIAPASEAVRFLGALLDGGIVRAATLSDMKRFRDTPALGLSSPSTHAAERSDGYGLGLVRMELPGFTLVGHGGLYNGHTAGVWRVEGCDITFALYLNRGFIDQRRALASVLPVLTAAPAPCAGGR